ncbi:ExeA family protein [Hydrocarboniclastica marina]|uniref:AAA family ATPase n=1 Tax=Hydrocarboniclastica marina TaxID=2259620 RepID=A0A4P7XDP6_9ALTE|nr:AAA family ATPase [Hydrocarboniclastica marina]MAL99601.1 AAA family ATPase [Alteromonadaceae bacterium]QCF24991.1 AAA family ATPase [Hydrocarboniclastica marina]|tara:strand:- start:1908 stop:2753 length:846 start_codon:yes stop_codon:yes gene_type:complete
MYESFFGLREMPFALTPNTRFFVAASSHREALELLTVGLAQGEGFLKISGEVGTGKTMLCRMLLNHLEGEAITAYLPNPQLSPRGLYQALADELDIAGGHQGNTHLILRRITRSLIQKTGQGQRVVLVIDEAQAMAPATLEALRLLTNLETESRKLLQVVLFGQPELDRVLDRDQLRQLKQRISFSCRLAALTRDSVDAYLAYRMQQAGYNGEPVFTAAAIRAITRASRGIPRLINLLAHKSLLAAWGRGDYKVGRWHARRATRDTESARPPGLLGWGILS